KMRYGTVPRTTGFTSITLHSVHAHCNRYLLLSQVLEHSLAGKKISMGTTQHVTEQRDQELPSTLCIDCTERPTAFRKPNILLSRDELGMVHSRIVVTRKHAKDHSIKKTSEKILRTTPGTSNRCNGHWHFRQKNLRTTVKLNTDGFGFPIASNKRN